MTAMTDTSAEKDSGFRIKGWHVLAGMVGFFGVIFTVNAIFITVALDTFPGEDTRRSYVQGLAYNDVLDQRAAQAELGWSASANLTAERVLIEVRDADGAPVRSLRLTGTLRHPADMDLDRALTFTELRAGVYAAGVADLPEGRWELNAEAEGDTPFAVAADLRWRR
jgi:nitrogen fixation protein FixH